MLPKKETLTIEFKSDTKKYPDSEIFEAVVALANTEGGDLYLGIENNGEMTGLHEAHLNIVGLSAYISNNTMPPVSVRTELIEGEGPEEKPVLKISVSKSLHNIVATASGKVLRRRLKADGTPENVPLYPSEFASRLSDLSRLDYSALPVYDATTGDFDPIEVARLRRFIDTYKGETALLELDDGELYKALGFVRTEHGQTVPTVTGLLLVGREEAIAQFLPTARSVFQVMEGTAAEMNIDIGGTVLNAIEEIKNRISGLNPAREIEIGLFRMPVYAFKPDAVREALVNAFSHRDYAMLGRVRVCISDEGLTIANPGGFLSGLSFNNLLSAEPRGRNPLLADALKRIGMAERTGRGIDRIYEGSLLYGKPLPDYSSSTSATVSLFIPRSLPDEQLVRLFAGEYERTGRRVPINALLVLNRLRDLSRASVKQLAESLHMKEIVVKSVLGKYVSAGIVEVAGTEPKTTYSLSEKVYKSGGTALVRQTYADRIRYREEIIRLAEERPVFSRIDVEALLKVDSRKAYRLLNELVMEGKLEILGKGRYATYRLAK